MVSSIKWYAANEYHDFFIGHISMYSSAKLDNSEPFLIIDRLFDST